MRRKLLENSTPWKYLITLTFDRRSFAQGEFTREIRRFTNAWRMHAKRDNVPLYSGQLPHEFNIPAFPTFNPEGFADEERQDSVREERLIQSRVPGWGLDSKRLNRIVRYVQSFERQAKEFETKSRNAFYDFEFYQRISPRPRSGRRLRREAGFAYFWKYEEGAAGGRSHFHILSIYVVAPELARVFRENVDKTERRRLKDKWRSNVMETTWEWSVWGHGIIDIEKIESETAAVRYVRKYASKKTGNLLLPEGKRAYSSSRSVPPAPPTTWRKARNVGNVEDVLATLDSDSVLCQRLDAQNLNVQIGTHYELDLCTSVLNAAGIFDAATIAAKIDDYVETGDPPSVFFAQFFRKIGEKTL